MKLLEMKIGRAELTTDHPQSNYGIPVLVLDGIAYGPDDMMGNGLSAGSVLMCSDAICCAGPATIADVDFLASWLRQSPVNGKQWEIRLRNIWR